MRQLARSFVVILASLGCASPPSGELDETSGAEVVEAAAVPLRGRRVPAPPPGCREPRVRDMADPRFVEPVGDRPGVEVHAFAAGGRLVVIEATPGRPARGEIYDLERDAWTDITSSDAPRFGSFDEGPGPLGSPRFFAFEDWVVVTWLDGNHGTRWSGAVLDAVRNTWRAMSTVGMPDRLPEATEHGAAGVYLRLSRGLESGYRYDVRADRWSPISTAGAPSSRQGGVAVVPPGSGRLLVWGGTNASPLGDGAVYDVRADRWAPIATVGAPSPRYGSFAAATDDGLVVWSGSAEPSRMPYLDDGGLYAWAEARWRPIPLEGAPDAEIGGASAPDVAWTGEALVVRALPGTDRGEPRRLAFFDPALGAWWRSETPSHAHPIAMAHGRVLLLDPASPRLYVPRERAECVIAIPSARVFASMSAGSLFRAVVRIGDELVVWGRTDFESTRPPCPRGAPCMPQETAQITSAAGAVLTP
ncbi:MAG: hypothetical protein KC619_00220 [Myxococcales bacterium]|nr:hypothetical protein [Myxococcales bacterium]